MNALLLVSVLIVSICGLGFELVAGALASYLLGDSITQFSFVIGTYMFSMGVGSWLSRFVNKHLTDTFVQVEILIGLVGGMSAPLLSYMFAHVSSFGILLYFFVTLIGMLVGIEIPLLMRILKDEYSFKDLVSKVLGLDYLGALAAALLFPLVLVPHLGLIRTSVLFGLINVLTALVVIYVMRARLYRPQILLLQGIGVALLLLLTGLAGERITLAAETSIFSDNIVFTRNTQYQRIVLTNHKDEFRLFLNGHLQFSSRDEYRYHEALVHPGLASLPKAQRVLVLGGGDGMAMREVLKYPNIGSATLVDLDPGMTNLFATVPLFTKLNGDALNSPKVKIINADAFVWLRETNEQYDFIVVDFPDPSNFSLGKLYTRSFYEELGKHLAPLGRIVVQSTSPLFARKSFWCIAETLKASGLLVFPYHAYVPSFGEWGFIMASREAYQLPDKVPGGLRFINASIVPQLFQFSEDMAPVPADINRLSNQVLVHYYDSEWRKISQ